METVKIEPTHEPVLSVEQMMILNMERHLFSQPAHTIPGTLIYQMFAAFEAAVVASEGPISNTDVFEHQLVDPVRGEADTVLFSWLGAFLRKYNVISYEDVHPLMYYKSETNVGLDPFLLASPDRPCTSETLERLRKNPPFSGQAF